MNDITALALLVSKAKASVFTMKYISQFEASDIDSDDVDLRFEVDGVETGTNVSIVDECGQAAQMITALVEALEVAEKTSAARKEAIERTHKMFQRARDRADAAEKRIAELTEERTISINEMSRIIQKEMKAKREAQHRIAQLESRTVTVTLPHDSEVELVADRCNRHRKEKQAAGIQVIEGEA